MLTHLEYFDLLLALVLKYEMWLPSITHQVCTSFLITYFNNTYMAETYISFLITTVFWNLVEYVEIIKNDDASSACIFDHV